VYDTIAEFSSALRNREVAQTLKNRFLRSCYVDGLFRESGYTCDRSKSLSSVTLLEDYLKEAHSIVELAKCENKLRAARSFADICSAPGAFSQLMLDYGVTTGKAITMPFQPGHKNVFRTMVESQHNFESILGDVTDNPTTRDLGRHDVVFCDGHVTKEVERSESGRSANSRDDYHHNQSNLHWSRVLVALNSLENGGCLFFQMRTSLTKDAIEMLVLCRDLFDSAITIKPDADSKHLLQSTAYFYFKGFKLNTYQLTIQRRLEKLLNNLQARKFDSLHTRKWNKKERWLIVSDDEVHDSIGFIAQVHENAWLRQTQALVAARELARHIEARLPEQKKSAFQWKTWIDQHERRHEQMSVQIRLSPLRCDHSKSVLLQLLFWSGWTGPRSGTSFRDLVLKFKWSSNHVGNYLKKTFSDMKRPNHTVRIAHTLKKLLSGEPSSAIKTLLEQLNAVNPKVADFVGKPFVLPLQYSAATTMESLLRENLRDREKLPSLLLIDPKFTESERHLWRHGFLRTVSHDKAFTIHEVAGRKSAKYRLAAIVSHVSIELKQLNLFELHVLASKRIYVTDGNGERKQKMKKQWVRFGPEGDGFSNRCSTSNRLLATLFEMPWRVPCLIAFRRVETWD
ncbi:MAG: hypothetical protein MHM6MM_007783, partial [Cercozoa sp. M6MM]